MTRRLRSAFAALLILALPVQAWASALAPCVWAKAREAGRASGPVAAPPVAGGAASHCNHEGAASPRTPSLGKGIAGGPCAACPAACGLCHLAAGAMLAPLPAAVEDLLRMVLNAGMALPDLSIPAAHAPPPPRS